MGSCAQYIHDQTRKAMPIRKWKVSAGIRFCRQCPKCGSRVGPWLKPGHLEELGKEVHPRNVPFSAPKKPFRGEGNSKAKKYAAYLRSSAWKRRRDAALERDNWECFSCGEIADQADHITYERFGNERLSDIRASCGDCNQQARQDRIGGGL